MIKTTTRMARTTAATTPAITAVLSSGSFGGVSICVIKSDESSCIIIETTQMNKTIIMNKIIQSEKSPQSYWLNSTVYGFDSKCVTVKKKKIRIWLLIHVTD